MDHPGRRDIHSEKKRRLTIEIWGKYNLKSGQGKWSWQRRLRRNSEGDWWETISDGIWEAIYGNILEGERASIILDVTGKSS